MDILQRFSIGDRVKIYRGTTKTLGAPLLPPPPHKGPWPRCQYGHRALPGCRDSVRPFLLNSSYFLGCNSALGLRQGIVKDSALSASSSLDEAHLASKGRLNGSAGWCASENDKQSYFVVGRRHSIRIMTKVFL